MLHFLVLPLVIALASPATSSLSPEAEAHNTKAMVFYDRGELAPAFVEFYAAYTTMPDPRRDRAGREILLGSMRAALLELHAADHDPAPLCRLQTVLHAHAEALAAAHPDSPDMLEIRSARARHDEVTAQLAALGPEVCATAPISSPPAETPKPTASAAVITPARPLVRTRDAIPPRQLRIAGGVTLGLGAIMLGMMTYGIVGETGHKASVDNIDANAAGRPLTTIELDDLLGHRQAAQSARTLAIGTGVAAGVMAALGTTLFVLAGRSARTQRWSAAPWWTPAGAGLTVRIQLHSAH